MTNTATQKLQYPIGPFASPDPVAHAHLTAWTADIERLAIREGWRHGGSP